ncbi:MAG TPA: NnrS family protein [Myxococcota bacterium]|nr:NnrS family protein [Myxococcota bacterium]
MTAFARGFRPFFLLAGLQACVSVPLWVAIFAGLVPAPSWLTPSLWHAHEMVFGFVAAAAAGFLLTAAPTWTQSPPLAGWPLAGLAALWLAGRCAMALAGRLPLELVALVDVAFLPALALTIARPIAAARQVRNYGFPALLAGLGALDLAVQLDALGRCPGVALPALHAAVDLVLVLVVLVGGRIAPAFTANALRRAGVAALVRTWPWLDRAAIGAVLAAALADLCVPRTVVSGAIAAVASLAVGARLCGWQTVRTLRDPLLWSLHLGQAWVAIGLAAVALADLAGALPWTVALHAETVGAIGTMVLAVMTRVALGHTGRPLRAPPAAVCAYLLVTAAALARTVGVLASSALGAIALAAALWSAAFAVFLGGYGAILLRPRVDGQPG